MDRERMMRDDLEEPEDGSTIVGDHFKQCVEVSAVSCFTVRSTECKREEV